MKGLTPICPYCGEFSEKQTGQDLYPHRPDLYHKTFYRCMPCDAYVGTHPGTDKPLGRLADAELRKWKNSAHGAFDPYWQSRMMSRPEAYKRLSKALGIEPQDCHIGMFDVAQCQRVVELCQTGQLTA